MKKNIVIIISILVVLILALVGIKTISFGTKEATMGANIMKIEVPALSTLEDECCTYEATFKTLRGKNSIQKELDNMVENYMEFDCNGKKVYYDINHNVTIFDYEVKGGTIFTTFNIKYNIGQTCE
ncbi:MAG: hypothetical protein E7174_00590 [Firmicutes bacterium]|nr:hypothetical protein [Bacillota bacterium]